MPGRKQAVALFILCVVLCLSFAGAGAQSLAPYSDVRDQDISVLDLRDQLDLVFTLSFDTHTKWPESAQMPAGFDPEVLLELGKDPGLGIRELQELGFNGAGVVVAYIDQGLLLNHTAYDNVKLHYEEIQPASPSMHGPAVLSLLAGKEIGLIPEAEVYYFAIGGTEDGNKYEALAFERILELNEILPENKKIQIVGMSHVAEHNLNKEYAEQLEEAQRKVRESGVIVVDVGCGMAVTGVKGYNDRDDYRNFEYGFLRNTHAAFFDGRLVVPGDNRTSAAGYLNDPNHYIYWGQGGQSWGVPYITGLIAMTLQINPDLTEAEAFHYLHATADDHLGAKLVNPRRFLESVASAANHPLSPRADMKNYRYFLYNFHEVTREDFSAISATWIDLRIQKTS